jgi:hypothetical protein
MAHPDRIREMARLRRRRILRGIIFGFFVAIVLPASIAVFVIARVGWQIYRHDSILEAEKVEMQRPENYKPAERYLARLMQSDPALWKSDDRSPPDWLPPEVGKMNPNGFYGSQDCFSVGSGGGIDDFFGYHMYRAQPAPGSVAALFTLNFVDGKELAIDQFTLPTTDHIDELEFVKSALAELARRQTAFANGSQANPYDDDPAADKARLLAQHPAIAAKLGYALPTTRPTMSLLPGG